MVVSRLVWELTSESVCCPPLVKFTNINYQTLETKKKQVNEHTIIETTKTKTMDAFNSKRISHEYTDYGLEAALMEGQHPRRKSGTPSHNDSFPVHLHWMLEETEKVGLSSVVEWSPHGRAFNVHNRDDFVEKVLPM